jgi:AraC family transcriptional regulator
MSATEWRATTCTPRPGSKPGTANSNPGQAFGKGGKAAAAGRQQDVLVAGEGARTEREDIMDVRVDTLPTRRVAYMRTVGAYGPEGDIPGLWQRLARWAQARDLWTPDRVCLGISHDNPHVTDPARCRLDAAIVVPGDFRPDGQVNVTEVEGGKYALGRFVGKADQVGRAYDEMFGRWLPASGYQPDSRPVFELYGSAPYDEKTGNFTCDICVPVKPL